MDIHGGRAIQDGPSNYLFAAYATTPVAITVEGANILTRSLITFAQGALRAHPYLHREIAAAQSPDRRVGAVAFDKAFCGHVGFMLANMTGSALHAATAGLFASSPVSGESARWFRRLARYAQSFALVADWTVVSLGGDLKRKQALAGRMADILSDLYLFSAVLKRYEDEGRLAEDKPLVTAIARDLAFSIEGHFSAVFANFPNRVLAFAMRALVFPLGRHARPASDRQAYRLARAVLRPGAFRDRLTAGIYQTTNPRDVTGVLEDGLIKVAKAEEVETKFVRAVKKGRIELRLDRDAITDAVEAGVLTEAEAALLRLADQASERVVAVDAFEPGELSGRQSSRRRVGAAAQ
jgi:acyl-CoA dehydrogenase